MPDGIRILGIKGFGTANAGIEYYNPRTRKNEILSMPRDNIKNITANDFRRLRNFLTIVTATPEGAALLGFAPGLLGTIEKSVNLEFDRPQVFANHKEIAKILNQQRGDWRVKMVDPYKLDADLIRMQKALGTPARLVEESHPSVYREAMRAASGVMTDHLLREGPKSWRTFRFFADSDFHNGQAFIDAGKKTIYLIDPGQSVRISKEEYQIGKTLVRTLSDTMDVNNAVRMLNASSINPNPKVPLFTVDEVKVIQKIPDPIEGFFKFLSLASSKGGEVPVPTVQWVLGINRQRVLGEKIGQPIEARLAKTFAWDSVKGMALRPGGCAKDLIALLKRLAPETLPGR
ncbi:MAG: hypothetical protein C5B49_04350 [Bdellovibrio sp.]|nr:MAG: hypothetical protein C5B49_04350 [Bdellovibrio sp.]